MMVLYLQPFEKQNQLAEKTDQLAIVELVTGNISWQIKDDNFFNIVFVIPLSHLPGYVGEQFT